MSDRALWLHAWVALGIARLAIRLLSLRRLVSIFGAAGVESALEVAERDQEQALRVGWAVASAGRLSPWQLNCFPRAIVAHHLLRRRRVASTLYLGAVLTAPSTPATGDPELAAHAWVRCGRWIVTGGDEFHKFAPVAHFATAFPSDSLGS